MLAAALLAGGCGGKPDARDLIIWARSADSATLDPGEVEWGEDIKIVRSLYEPLVSFKDDFMELEGRLATGWTLSPDGLTLTFELRQGVTFHDGAPFTSEAVVFSFQRLLDPAHPHRPRATPHVSNFREIERVEAAGPHKVVFALRRRDSVILQRLALYTASIVSPGAVRRHGESFPANPSGTGPLRLARWERGVRMQLETFPGYWGPKPPVPRVLVLPVPSPQTAVEKLRKGEVHVVDHPALGDVRALERDPSVRVCVRESLNICCLGFNMRRAPYNDLHFRRAVSLALDRRALNELAYHGLADPAANVVPPSLWGDIAPTPPYEHDLAKAREELARANLPSNEVELIHVTISRPYMPEPRRVAEWVKDQLRKIGLDVKLTGYDKSAYGQKTREEGHPMFLLGWSGDFPDPDNYLYPLLHGDNAGDLSGSFFDDPEFDDAVSRARGEPDPARRRELHARAYARYREEMPTLPQVHLKQIVVVATGVDYRMHPVETRLHAAGFAPR
jgi:ABC-type transport system substrate-binding protein